MVSMKLKILSDFAYLLSSMVPNGKYHKYLNVYYYSEYKHMFKP